jgi:hypothetical protein
MTDTRLTHTVAVFSGNYYYNVPSILLSIFLIKNMRKKIYNLRQNYFSSSKFQVETAIFDQSGKDDDDDEKKRTKKKKQKITKTTKLFISKQFSFFPAISVMKGHSHLVHFWIYRKMYIIHFMRSNVY